MAVKKLVYMSEAQAQLLRTLARQANTSEAEVMRQALEAFARQAPEDPFRIFIGMCDAGPTHGAENHDRYIYGVTP